MGEGKSERILKNLFKLRIELLILTLDGSENSSDSSHEPIGGEASFLVLIFPSALSCHESYVGFSELLAKTDSVRSYFFFKDLN